MSTVPLRPVGEQSAPLSVSVDTFEVLLELLDEADQRLGKVERKLAGVVAALRDDRRRAA